MTDECILCYEPVSIYAIGKCNHNPICHLCSIKSRNILKNKYCSICKEELKEIILSKVLKTFTEIQSESLSKYNNEGVFYNESSIKEELDKINKLQCWIPSCNDPQVFNTIAFLKKHLKEKHQRYLCDICFENKTAILKEQKIYSSNSLQKHLENGDHDDDGNLIFFHPFCTFCNKYFYNEDIFMKHLQQVHIACDLCGSDYKFVYYNAYKNLEIHYKLSHYLCQDPNCLAQGFIAFKTLAEFELHNVKIHSGETKLTKQQQKMMNTFTLQTITGFVYDDNKPKNNREEKFQFNDNEGNDFEEQFLSQKRTKLKALSEKDTQIDTILDIRDFYQNMSNFEDRDDEDSYLERLKSNDEHNNYNKKKAKKGGYQMVFLPKQDIFLENVKLIKYKSLKNITTKVFDDKIAPLIDQEKFNNFWTYRKEYTTSKITAEEFFKKFEDIFGKKPTFKYFPYFISSIQNEETQRELDDVLLTEIRNLPKQKENILTISYKYSDLITNLLKYLEDVILARIKSKVLSIKTKNIMDKSRIFQLIEIIRRVKTVEMAKFKFLTNFGVSLKNIEVLTKKILTVGLEEIPLILDEFPNEELLPLYLYLTFCSEILAGKKIHKEKNQISSNILKEFIKKNQEELQKYLPKDLESSSSDEEIIPNKKQPAKKAQKDNKKPIKPPIEEIKVEEESKNFDTKCKFEFPAFTAPEPVEKAVSKHMNKKKNNNNNNVIDNKNQTYLLKPKKIDSTNLWEKQNQNPFIYYSTENKVTKKALNEEFPSLLGTNIENKGGGEGGGNNKNNDENFEDEEFKINADSNDVVGKKGKGKNKKLIYTGGFY